jgi:hypothetical protein
VSDWYSFGLGTGRAVKRYREEGPKGFHKPRKRRGPAVLTAPVLAAAQQLLDEGLATSEVADRLSNKRDTPPQGSMWRAFAQARK